MSTIKFGPRAIGWLGIGLMPLVARQMHVAWRATNPSAEPWLPYLVIAALILLLAAMLGSPPRTSASADVMVNAIVTSVSVFGATAISQVIVPNSLPRFVVVETPVLTFTWLMLFGAYSVNRLRRQGAARRVVAVVNAQDGEELRRDVDTGPWEQHFSLVDVITEKKKHGSIGRICRKGRATTLVLGPKAAVDPVALSEAEQLHREGVQVRSVDVFYDEFLGKLPLSALDRFAIMTDVDSVHGAYAPLKRAMDVWFALMGAVVMLLLLPFVLIGNLIGNRGPLWFTQERVGRGDQPFKIWKFRTMNPGAVDISGWTSEQDPRITPFGKFLRRTHIDELPQVFNILVGDLSVVGPRPEQVSYAKALEASLPFYSARHLVRPGLTGWAQVRYQYAASEEDAFVKLQYDLYYIRHESLGTDIRIIWLTLRHLLVGGGR